MNRFGLTNKKALIVLFGLALLAFLSNVLRSFLPHVYNLSAILYCTLFIAWGLSIRRRIPVTAIRKRLHGICYFMVALFVVRTAKFNFFNDSIWMNEHLWYAYYIPMTAIPLLSLMVALRTEPVKNARRISVIENGLVIVEMLLIFVVITNSMHNMVFEVRDMYEEDYSRGWFYYVILAWMIGMIVATLAILLAKTTLSAVRKMWYIPTLFLLAGFALLIWYLVVGGSPMAFGVKLYHLQEAFCFPFITMFESAIQTRLIPANTGYELLFDYSSINAGICDADGQIVLTSRSFAGEVDPEDKDHQLKKEHISGGFVEWVDDKSAINRLNEEMADVAEQLEEENELIKQENDIRAERVSFETKNRLYNKIAKAVKAQAIKVNELLESEELVSRERLIYAAFLSAFIKRMGNLMLISDKSGIISTEELRMAIRESMDYMELNNISCDIMENETQDLPAAFNTFIYGFFQQLIEDNWNQLHSCFVSFEKGADFEITIAIDAPTCRIKPEWKKEFTEIGSRISFRNEDETIYVTIACDSSKIPVSYSSKEALA